jgi:hypothetical protein
MLSFNYLIFAKLVLVLGFLGLAINKLACVSTIVFAA